MSQILIKKSLFDDYFNLLYKIEYDNLIGKESSDNESDNESNNESWITEIKTNVKPIQLDKKIKKQIEY
jgi:hypothetical protein